MRCVTWTKDSHGLFDYESKNISKKNIKTHTGGKIILVGDEMQLVSKNYIFGQNSCPLLILERDSEYLGKPLHLIDLTRCRQLYFAQRLPELGGERLR